jgi:hypothetical protein
MNTEEKRTLILILGGSGLVFALLIAAVFVFDLRGLVQSTMPQLQESLGDAAANVLPMPRIEYDENGEAIFEDELRLPQNVSMMGMLERGQRVEGLIGMYRMEGWLLQGRAGDHYRLDFEALDGGYSWQMSVYGPDQTLWQYTADSEHGLRRFLPARLHPAGGRALPCRPVGLRRGWPLCADSGLMQKS